MIEKILIFILFLGPLVFFHELGHFLFARLFGVRVEVFSIGFGPKLFKFKRGDTEYALSLIPLGGYVKMFGDDPLNKDAVPVEDRKFSFTHKSKFARFWIVFGGPFANFIMAYVIFFFLLLGGEKIPELKVGVVGNQTKFHQIGIRTGDVLKKVNDNPVSNPSDIVLQDGGVKTLTVSRYGADKKLTIGMEGEAFFEEMMNYPPFLRRPILTDLDGNTFAVSFSATEVNWNTSLDEIAARADVTDVYLYKMAKDAKLTDINVKEEKPFKKKLSVNSKNDTEFFEYFKKMNIYPKDMIVKSITMKSPAEKAGILGGHVILGLEGKSIYSFEVLRSTLQKIDKKDVSVTLLADGKEKTVILTPDVKPQGKKKVKLIGVYSSGVFQGMRFVDTPSKGLVGSFLGSFGRTWETIVKTVDSFKKLIVGDVSLKNIGGPLAIGKVASDSFNTSLSYFFQLMALISVNLGVINLFPIPVLDGGHILFIILEVINRGPVSRRKMEIAQQFGLSILLMLMIGAIFNDFVRFF
jgi:regulator of sigma E protease